MKNLRFVLILAAVSAAAGGAIYVDYLHTPARTGRDVVRVEGEHDEGTKARRPVLPVPQPVAYVPASGPVAPRVVAPPASRIEAPALGASTAPAASAPGSVFKCRSGDKLVYSDVPCTGEQRERIAAYGGPSNPAPGHSYTEQLARMQAREAASAPARSAASPPVEVAQSQPAAAPVPDKATQCKVLHDEVQRIDAVLRQPHSAWDGDFWTERRRKANDEIFRLKC